MINLAVPIIVIVIGEGGSGGALGIGVGDKICVLENAYYSVISPEGCAAILWKDRTKAPEAAKALKLTAQDLLKLGLIDMVIPEPLGGAHRDPAATVAKVKSVIKRYLKELCPLPKEDLLRKRYEKFRAIGVFENGCE
jgi:acetyl-CoA carboxylase carboxyl transferase subunit alpha